VYIHNTLQTQKLNLGIYIKEFECMTQHEILEWLEKHKRGTANEISKGTGIPKHKIPCFIVRLENKRINIERLKDEKTKRMVYELKE
jgi:transcription initiation factor IIE alpha subunit